MQVTLLSEWGRRVKRELWIFITFGALLAISIFAYIIWVSHLILGRVFEPPFGLYAGIALIVGLYSSGGFAHARIGWMLAKKPELFWIGWSHFVASLIMVLIAFVVWNRDLNVARIGLSMHDAVSVGYYLGVAGGIFTTVAVWFEEDRMRREVP